MQQPYVGAILCVAFNRIPQGWVPCDGRLLLPAQYSALYAVIGNRYGGTPNFNFAVPDIRSRILRGPDKQIPIATQEGVENVQLNAAQSAPHTHKVQVNSGPANTPTLAKNLLSAGASRGIAVYAPPGNAVDLDAASISQTGGSDAHSNLQPYLPINFLIAHSGYFPDQPLPDSDPFTGEIRIYPWGLIPRNWAACNGQSLSVASYPTLFGLIGNAFGGDGVNNFKLPDLRGRTPLGAGQGPNLSNYPIGQQGGAETISLTTSQMPQHSHQPHAVSGAATTINPSGAMLATGASVFAKGPDNSALNTNTIASAGVGEGHDNMMPFLSLNFCICLTGLYPTWSE
ncbi:MAG: tail fiber protein [Acidobacteria bacterium]|nr:tail fiber protein [Acidobacteriota bacterium]